MISPPLVKATDRLAPHLRHQLLSSLMKKNQFSHKETHLEDTKISILKVTHQMICTLINPSMWMNNIASIRTLLMIRLIIFQILSSLAELVSHKLNESSFDLF